MDTTSMDAGERMKAGVNIVLKELNEANLHVHKVLYGLIDGLLEVAIGKPLETLDQLRISITGAPAPTRIALPMFIDVGAKVALPK
jgi:hypothetical protein